MRRVISDSESIQAGNEEIRVRQIIRHSISTDQRFNNGWESIRVAMRIEQACSESEKGELFIDEGDYEKLRQALEQPQPLSGFYAYPVLPAHRASRLLKLIFDSTLEHKS